MSPASGSPPQQGVGFSLWSSCQLLFSHSLLQINISTNKQAIKKKSPSSFTDLHFGVPPTALSPQFQTRTSPTMLDVCKKGAGGALETEAEKNREMTKTIPQRVKKRQALVILLLCPYSVSELLYSPFTFF